MHPTRRPGRALALAGALLAAACGGDTTTAPSDTTAAPSTDSTTTAGSGSTATSATTGTTATTATTQPAGTVVEVTVTGGEVEGPGRVEVPLGEDVTVRVTSDVADEVHVHGYDLFADVPAGGTGEVSFTADLPGVYEVELEGAHLPLVELAVG